MFLRIYEWTRGTDLSLCVMKFSRALVSSFSYHLPPLPKRTCPNRRPLAKAGATFEGEESESDGVWDVGEDQRVLSSEAVILVQSS